MDMTPRVNFSQTPQRPPMTMWSQIVLGLALALLILITVCGNVLVCVAVCATRRLRCITNCFIVSLAVTDLLLATLVLPFSALIEITERWPLGPCFCNIYISLDVMLSTASILNLLAISVDRYLVITTPLRYPTRMLPWRVAVALAAIWLVSIAVSFLPIHLGWNTIDMSIQNLGEGDKEGNCHFELNPSYVLVDSCLTFYLPLLAMCWAYHKVFCIARAQAKRILLQQLASSPGLNGATMLAVREHKATVTLAVVLGAFVICWFPYFTYFTVRGIQEEKDPPGAVYSVVLWLGYANSALNPLLYGLLNRDFRAGYARLLCRGRRFATPIGTPASVSKEAVLVPGTSIPLWEMETQPRTQQSKGFTATMGTAVTNDDTW